MPDLLQTYLDTPEGAAQVLAHARLLLKLAGWYQEIAPPHLGQASSVANLKSGIVVIHATSGAVASKLRQLAPTLVDAFSQRGLVCTGVQVKVHARQGQTAATQPTLKPLSNRASQELQHLSESLPASPLRAALETLLARSSRQE